ncbi:hypothetical protein K431DRAFT_324672 [Polychaeton citri CBS 116435]|uniref:Sister chromatid cohesion protein Dcc1 n=1 Tax=Polychaeton citri CBS 116435 TaxID=1314669 RepID=A0A9P4QFD1_9PEZI|nr:hypothetical protein K431DRAFT_324672 [Polychaeton citri CBS 116435]
MSTQDQTGIEFSVVPEEHQERFRLLELPPELLALLTQEDAEPLLFKATDSSDGNTPQSAVKLCTDDKTYSIRQVNTSNSVYLARPGLSVVADGGLPPPASVEAFAQCDSFLEATLQAKSSAVSHIRSQVPVYSSTGHYGGKSAVTRGQLYDNIPLSKAECDESWIELACFEMRDSAGSFIPSAAARIQAWSSILTNAAANTIDLTSQIANVDVELIVDDTEDWPVELTQAVLYSVRDMSEGTPLIIDQAKCLRLVGASLLETYQTKGLPTSEFRARWADLLPERWRGSKGPDLQAIQGSYNIEGTTIVFVEKDASNGPQGSKTTLGVKRAWHEKFRQSKKAG